MEKEYFGKKFYESKLNTVLLFVLIVLMVIALRFMYMNQQALTPSSPTVSGNSQDLISSNIHPGQKVSGKVKLTATVKGEYFFEANIGVSVLDKNKKLLTGGNGTAIGDWQTLGPVAFTADVDFTNLPLGPAYLEIHNDNPSGMAKYDKSILIPIVIK
jgi:hypothetical protein